MMIVQPKELADGSYVFNLVRIDIEYHPETTSTEVASLRYNGSQLLTDADVDNFITAGSLA
jgi:hypothetical protein